MVENFLDGIATPKGGVPPFALADTPSGVGIIPLGHVLGGMVPTFFLMCVLLPSLLDDLDATQFALVLTTIEEDSGEERLTAVYGTQDGQLVVREREIERSDELPVFDVWTTELEEQWEAGFNHLIDPLMLSVSGSEEETTEHTQIDMNEIIRTAIRPKEAL